MAIKARVEAFHEIKSKSFINNWTRQPSDKRSLVRGNVGIVNDDGVDVAEGGGSALALDSWEYRGAAWDDCWPAVDEGLREAAEGKPMGHDEYQAIVVALPSTGDTLQAVFSATVALQVLALKMSMKKRAYLEDLGVRGHGVDPDAPKNVSKSITVD